MEDLRRIFHQRNILGKSVNGKGLNVRIGSLENKNIDFNSSEFIPSNYSELLKHSCVCYKNRYTFILSEQRFISIIKVYLSYKYYDKTLYDSLIKYRDARLHLNGSIYTFIKKATE